MGGKYRQSLGSDGRADGNNYLRGFIQEYEMDGDTICVEAEEAWGTTDFRHVLAQLIPRAYYLLYSGRTGL